jgi:hypothetical protein
MNHEQADDAARELILVVMPPEADAALDSVGDEVGQTARSNLAECRLSCSKPSKRP